MTFRCTSTCEIKDHTFRLAQRLPCADHGEVDWAFLDDLRCVLGEEEHEFHATWLRSGSELEKDVYLCWRDDPGTQWIVDAEVCLKTKTPLGSSCTIYKGHPGKCEWDHVDLEAPARSAGEFPDDGLVRP
jgi:hypothetical protein